MVTLATDDFNRADTGTGTFGVNLLGSNWNVNTLEKSLHISSNTATIQDDNNDFANYYSNVTWPNDHYSQANLTTSSTYSGDDGPGILVRMTGGGVKTYYRMVWARTQANPLQIGKKNSGTFTHLASLSATISSGDLIKLGIQSTTLTGYVNGTSQGTTTDSALSTGNAGLGYSSENGAQTASMDNWEGGDFTSAGLPPGLGPDVGMEPSMQATTQAAMMR